jgi:hypothetical protein
LAFEPCDSGFPVMLTWLVAPLRAQYGPVYVCGGSTLFDAGGNGPAPPAQE